MWVLNTHIHLGLHTLVSLPFPDFSLIPSWENQDWSPHEMVWSGYLKWQGQDRSDGCDRSWRLCPSTYPISSSSLSATSTSLLTPHSVGLLGPQNVWQEKPGSCRNKLEDVSRSIPQVILQSRRTNGVGCTPSEARKWPLVCPSNAYWCDPTQKRRWMCGSTKFVNHWLIS